MHYTEKRLLHTKAPRYTLAVEDYMGLPEVAIEMTCLPDRESVAKLNRLAALIKASLLEQYAICEQCEGHGHYPGFAPMDNEPSEVRCKECGGEKCGI